ncbi:hypothetical protein ACVS9P_07730 [Caproicibacterium sp. NSD3]
MKFYFRRDSGDNMAYGVYDESGKPAFLIKTNGQQLGLRLIITTPQEIPVARLRILGMRELYHCGISIEGQTGMQVVLNPVSRQHPVRIRGRDWRFRGNLIDRSFDFVDSHASLIMTHSSAYGVSENDYVLVVPDDRHALEAVCIAAAVDCQEQILQPAPLPV